MGRYRFWHICVHACRLFHTICSPIFEGSAPLPRKSRDSSSEIWAPSTKLVKYISCVMAEVIFMRKGSNASVQLSASPQSLVLAATIFFVKVYQ